MTNPNIPTQPSHWDHAIEALPDFAWLAYDGIEHSKDPGKIAELEESVRMFEEWLEGRSLWPTL